VIYYLAALEDGHETEDGDFVVLCPIVFPADSDEEAAAIAQAAADELGLGLVDDPVRIHPRPRDALRGDLRASTEDSTETSSESSLDVLGGFWDDVGL